MIDMISQRYKGTIFSDSVKFRGISDAIRKVEEKRDDGYIFYNIKYRTDYPICIGNADGFWAIPVTLTVGRDRYFNDTDFDADFDGIGVFVGDPI